jgi:hypothetical protein
MDPTPQDHTTSEGLVEVVEAPLVKKRRLTKVVELEVPMAKPDALVLGEVNVAGFLAARRRKVLLPPVLSLAEVEAFIANELVLVVPVAVPKPIEEEPLQAPEGSILLFPLWARIFSTS